MWYIGAVENYTRRINLAEGENHCNRFIFIDFDAPSSFVERRTDQSTIKSRKGYYRKKLDE